MLLQLCIEIHSWLQSRLYRQMCTTITCDLSFSPNILHSILVFMFFFFFLPKSQKCQSMKNVGCQAYMQKFILVVTQLSFQTTVIQSYVKQYLIQSLQSNTLSNHWFWWGGRSKQDRKYPITVLLNYDLCKSFANIISGL